MLTNRNPSGFGLCYQYHVTGTTFHSDDNHLEKLKKDLVTLTWKPTNSIYHTALDFAAHATDTTDMTGGNGVDSAYGIVLSPNHAIVKPHQTLYVIFGMHKNQVDHIHDDLPDDSIHMRVSEKRQLRRELRSHKGEDQSIKKLSNDIAIRRVVYNPIYHGLFRSLNTVEKSNDAKDLNDVKKELAKLYSNVIDDAGQVRPITQPRLFANLRKRYCSVEHKEIISEIGKTQSIYGLFKLLASTSLPNEYQLYHQCVLVILLHSSRLKDNIQQYYLKDITESTTKLSPAIATIVSSYLDAKQNIPEISEGVLPNVFKI